MDITLSRELSGRLRRLVHPRRSLARRLAGIGPMWMGLAFAIVTVLGVMGFTRYQEAAGAVESLATRLYRALQLFVAESGAVSGPMPWELQVARFAAPIVAAYALLRALAAVFHDQVDLLRLRSLHGHVVVAGLGRKGSSLAQALLRRGERVVVIEACVGNPGLDTVRAIGGLVVIGDARIPATLHRAGVARAGQLVVLCGGDGTNIEIVAGARQEASGRRSGSLHCVVHLTNPELALLLCAEELERYGEAPFRVDFVNVYAVAAQALLRAHPPFQQHDGTAPRVSVIGAGPTAHHLLPALARAWASRSPQDGQRLAVGVVGPDAQALAALEKRHPELVRFAEVQAFADLVGVVVERMPAMVYVCPDDDEQAAASALEMRNLLAGHPTAIVVVLEQRSGLGRLLEGARQPAGGPSLVTFGLLDEACQPDVLLAGMTEALARALHGAYLDAADADARPDDPALRPWRDLPESLRESNRDQAAHVAVKLAAVGQAVGPLIDWGAAQQPFDEHDVEIMARLEHERWVGERRRAGWSPGPRDSGRRTTPYLVPWEDLSEQVRDQDRLFVRRLPQLLATVGLQALRRQDARMSQPMAAEAHGTAADVLDAPGGHDDGAG